MRCDEIREQLSARLDGETTDVDDAGLTAHVAGCADCARWEHDVTALSRRAKVRGAESAPAELVSGITAAVEVPPAAGWRRRILALRIALVAAGLAQLSVAVPAVFHDDIGMPMSSHGSHESAAWNLAVAAALFVVAARPRAVVGALATVGSFVVVLAGLSTLDLLAGAVDPVRLLTHLAVAVGAALLFALHRTVRALPGGVPADPEQQVTMAPKMRRRDVA